ncbi:MAG TPA: HD domain-containing protein [Accumulibacter sp.]|nr:HD domain-containing protein [Accumulibacter sp.]HMW18695.1 HD domain-containing protein [Accumulibacter sp.]HNC18789.1 HD domain-containing protein [Accumulibacter sp.]HND81470.1 HD domain-containing protein [Accumulibacter sp.]HNE13973.1 HD domain-containing protein [Accumulibacter sp.]
MRDKHDSDQNRHDQRDRLDKVRAFAVLAHGNQMYGERPYSYHLDAVAELLVAYGSQAQAIAYLHDVVEDTVVTVDDIRMRFGTQVADCVNLLTDAPGASRAERKAGTYARMAAVVDGPLTLALLVKTADRLANVRSCVADGKGRLWEVYRREHPAFRQAVHRPGLCEAMWDELAELLELAAPAAA